MNQAVAKLINEQINKEFYSAYLYLDFANYYAQVGLDGFENWYKEHEKYVTASIDAIYAAAYEVRDFRTMQTLDWFIKEQGEEEKNASDLITKMELFGGDSKGLYMLNSELKARTYAAPTLVLD